MPRENNLELKVGAFVAATLICLVGFVLSISDFSIFKKGTIYTVEFHFANGLKKNAPVRLAGVDAGHIRDIRVFYDPQEQKTRVSTMIWMEDGVHVPVGSHYLINQLGILGEKYLEIMPGASNDFVKPGSVLLGDDPVPLETITNQISALGGKLEETLTGVNTGILSEANKKALAETLSNMAAVTGALRQGEGTIGKFLTDKSVFENLDEFTADLKANPWKLFYRPKGKK